MPDDVRDLVASFQRAVVTALLRRLKIAAEELRPRSLLLTGGVAANSLLRAEAAALADSLGLPLFVPPIALSTDNAAMIGAAGFVAWRKGRRAGWDLDRRHAPAPRLRPVDLSVRLATIVSDLYTAGGRRTGGDLEPDEPRATPEMRRALSSFYREEFLRHLEHLQSNGLVNAGNRDVIDRAYTQAHEGPGAASAAAPTSRPLAETLLQNFDTLTRLSSLDRRQSH